MRTDGMSFPLQSRELIAASHEFFDHTGLKLLAGGPSHVWGALRIGRRGRAKGFT